MGQDGILRRVGNPPGAPVNNRRAGYQPNAARFLSRNFGRQRRAFQPLDGKPCFRVVSRVDFCPTIFAGVRSWEKRAALGYQPAPHSTTIELCIDRRWAVHSGLRCRCVEFPPRPLCGSQTRIANNLRPLRRCEKPFLQSNQEGELDDDAARQDCGKGEHKQEDDQAVPGRVERQADVYVW